MSNKIHVKVTKDHIERGERWLPRCCPLALAIRDVVSNEVAVMGDIFSIGKKYYTLPPEAIKFVGDYDDCDVDISSLEEFECDIDLSPISYDDQKNYMNDMVVVGLEELLGEGE